MFNFLKDKLKNWASKLKPEEVKSSKSKEKTSKIKAKSKKSDKIVKEKPVKQKKQKTKISEQQKQEERKITDKVFEDIKQEKIKKQEEEKQLDTEEVKEEQEKKKSFFSKLFGKEESKEEKAEEVEKQEEKESKEQVEEKEEKSSFFNRFKTKLTEEKFDELFQELEMALLQNNVALEVVEDIKKYLRDELVGKNLSDIKIEEKLKKAIENVLINPPDFIKEIKRTLAVKKPFVIAFVGINGSGKTTTIAKVTNLLKNNKFSVCLAAADTFRAASIEQLQQHADKLQVHLIKKDYNSDPASVGFEAIQYAKKHSIDIVLIDTAGRMNTKDSLMKEMEKIIKVCKPDMKIFIGESITGNDATEVARAFNNSIDLTGIILSKADVDEKGGTSLSVSYVTKKPIFFLGVGQSYNDLEVFDKKKIIKRLGLD